MVGTTLALFLCSRWSKVTIDPCDVLFGLFIGCIVVSFAVNQGRSDHKQIFLLMLSLCAYPSARLFAGSKGIAPSFLFCTAAIAIVGAALTIPALPEQWNDSYGRPHPVVFGEFGAATIQFTLSLGFLAIALVCVQLTRRQATWGAAVVTALTIVFATSFVRFSFVAIGTALAFAWLTSSLRGRNYAATMIGLMIAGVIVGNVARVELPPRFSGHVPTVAPAPALAFIPTIAAVDMRTTAVADEVVRILVKTNEENRKPCPTIDLQDSIAIRKQLYLDAFGILPNAGLFGIGMDHFLGLSCIKDSQVHNTILQVAIELGWTTAILLVALLVRAGRSLWLLSHCSREARFALCGLVFAVTLAMGHGRISQDFLIFLFLGYAAGIKAMPQILTGAAEEEFVRCSS
ncbi:hypothetical protein UP09_18590 [Bradyrhizobium sp. LTSP885]|nr:hypothetical protein UP09_18590 [Bradyrhizobium sp. LTSP885]